MKTEKIQIIAGVVFLGLCIVIFNYRVASIKSKSREISSQYPSILKNDSLNNYVVIKHTFGGFKYTPTMVFVTLDNGKVCKINSGLSAEYSNKGINDVLEEGDRLQKKIGSDTIYILKPDSTRVKSFHFLLKNTGSQ